MPDGTQYVMQFILPVFPPIYPLSAVWEDIERPILALMEALNARRIARAILCLREKTVITVLRTFKN